MPRTKVPYISTSTSKRVLCHCPMCDKDHIYTFKYGYTGKVVKPWKNCKSCEGLAEHGSEPDLCGIMSKGKTPKDPYPDKSGKQLFIRSVK